jgi:hypothetical protein
MIAEKDERNLNGKGAADYTFCGFVWMLERKGRALVPARLQKNLRGFSM